MLGNTKGELAVARRALAGEAEAWTEIVETYGPRIHRLARHFARDEAGAEDLTQEIFLKLFRNLHRYRGKVPLGGWILRVSRNLCIDEYRRRRRESNWSFLPHEQLDELPTPRDPVAEAERRELVRLVRWALSALDEETALVVSLRDFHGFSYTEISVLVGAPVGTVKSRIHRGRRELRRCLEPSRRQPATVATGDELWRAAVC